MAVISSKQVEKILKDGAGRDHSIGAGLYLRVKKAKKGTDGPHGGAVWIVKRSRTTPTGRQQISRSIGELPEVDLHDARAIAERVIDAFECGVDPDQVLARSEAVGDDKHDLPTETGFVFATADSTFDELARMTFNNESKKLRSDKYKKQWWNSLEKPLKKLGHMPVADITPAHIGEVLYKDWNRTPDSARKLAQRLAKVFEFARGVGAISHDMPSPVAAAKVALGPQTDQVEHHKSLPYQDAPAFYARLSERPAISALALRWIMITATRSNETRGMLWDEVDVENRIWTIPPARMKTARVGSDKTHTVFLSQTHLDLLDELRGITGGKGLVFPNTNGKVMSDDVFRALFRRMGCTVSDREGAQLNVTAHGFRTTFRTWVEECTALDTRSAEQILSHSVGNAVEMAYQRNAKRSVLMRQMLALWCDYLLGKVTVAELHERFFPDD